MKSHFIKMKSFNKIKIIMTNKLMKIVNCDNQKNIIIGIVKINRKNKMKMINRNNKMKIINRNNNIKIKEAMNMMKIISNKQIYGKILMLINGENLMKII
jgi:hypothetical protein